MSSISHVDTQVPEMSSSSEESSTHLKFYYSKSPTLFQQHKRRLYTWTSPDDQHRNQIDYILCSQRWRSSIQSAKTRPGADCDSDHELLIAKFRLKLKKVGKPLDHSGMTYIKSLTVEVRNRFKGLDLMDRVPDKLWTGGCDIVLETVIKTIPKKKKCKKAKWLSMEALQTAEKRREAEGKGKNERYTSSKAEFQRSKEKTKRMAIRKPS